MAAVLPTGNRDDAESKEPGLFDPLTQKDQLLSIVLAGRYG